MDIENTGHESLLTCPFSIRATFNKEWITVLKTHGMVAASSKGRSSETFAHNFSETTIGDAKQPPAESSITVSPMARLWTLGPTLVTVPDASMPMFVGESSTIPIAKRRS
jgi:hypothetical protein